METCLSIITPIEDVYYSILYESFSIDFKLFRVLFLFEFCHISELYHCRNKCPAPNIASLGILMTREVD
jgi:hypothetical protein